MYQTRSGVATLPLIECTSRRHDCWVLRYGCQKEADTEERTGESYVYWAHDFGHKPTLAEIKQVIIDHIDAQTDERILTGYEWTVLHGLHEGLTVNVWLSNENQTNYKAIHDAAIQHPDKVKFPKKFKIWEDTNNKGIYEEFEALDEIVDFYLGGMAHIEQCTNEGWAVKDTLDFSEYESQLEAL